jgi:ubiquinone biosynthesis protein UbiJ
MATPAVGFLFSKLLNRVLTDYALAREQLARHAPKEIALDIGPAHGRVRVTPAGEVEPVGTGGSGAADVTFSVPLRLLPRLAAKDEAAMREVKFEGDSELAALLADLSRHLEWDIEEDLSRVVGDIAAHRIVGAARSTHAWRQEAGQRLSANLAEYLTEERRAFITSQDLDSLARANETLRDDIARLEARLDLITPPPSRTAT